MYQTQRTNVMPLKNQHNRYHTYAIEWSAARIEYYLDGVKTFSFEKESNAFAVWPFDQPFHLILNMAVGGDFGGRKGIDDTIFPTQMHIDYVRVYQ